MAPMGTKRAIIVKQVERRILLIWGQKVMLGSLELEVANCDHQEGGVCGSGDSD